MRAASHLTASIRTKSLRSPRIFTSGVPCTYGRCATYQRLPSSSQNALSSIILQSSPPRSYTGRGRSFSRKTLAALTSRSFTSATIKFQEQRQAESAAGSGGAEDGRSAGQQDTKDSDRNSEDQARSKSESTDDQTGGQGGRDEQANQEKKKDAPPPPPHGNKSPWQVFTETLQSEFKASKEWNESTKAIASSAHQFTENESVKRARAAYTAASGAASSTTTSALKSTGKVIGQSAAWTWDTPVVKGVRTGVNLTGKGIEKATRPVRETQVYKTAMGGVKDVIDDGSSSRYGGWLEKEERRKQRELRELKEAAGTGGRGKRVEKMEEDPE